MKKNIYNIVWADDEIDDILDEIMLEDLKEEGFKVVGKAHDGEELGAILDQVPHVDAVRLIERHTLWKVVSLICIDF